MTLYRRAFEKWRVEYLRQALKACDGNVLLASKLIGVHRCIFYKFAFRSAAPTNRGSTEWQALGEARL